MSEQPDMELREATLPDGTKMTLAVARGLPQDEVDLLAAQPWSDLPEG